MDEKTIERQKKRAEWLPANPFRKGMTFSECCEHNEKLYTLFPLTREEQEHRQRPVDVEFVL